jgi:hypothetical protein
MELRNVKPRLINFLHPVMVGTATKSHFDPRYYEVTIESPFNVIIEELATGKRGRTTMYNAIYYQLEGDNEPREARAEKEENFLKEESHKKGDNKEEGHKEEDSQKSDNKERRRGSDRPDPKPRATRSKKPSRARSSKAS